MYIIFHDTETYIIFSFYFVWTFVDKITSIIALIFFFSGTLLSFESWCWFSWSVPLCKFASIQIYSWYWCINRFVAKVYFYFSSLPFRLGSIELNTLGFLRHICFITRFTIAIAACFICHCFWRINISLYRLDTSKFTNTDRCNNSQRICSRCKNLKAFISICVYYTHL